MIKQSIYGKNRFHIAIIAGLILTIVIVYGQVREFEFIAYDDPGYVYKNPSITKGLTLEGILRAFQRDGFAHYYHPLTWISHMLDCELFGVHPGPQHLVNVVFHILNSLLLYGVLWAMTGKIIESAMVAFLFALHPLNVESVAWIAARKNLLSTLFFWVTLGMYHYYAQSPNRVRYGAVLVPFLLGVLSKPMLVTVPFLLLLLDFWPLSRFGRARIGGLILEKIPLFGISFLFIWLSSGALDASNYVTFEDVPLVSRLANGGISYFLYLKKVVWPYPMVIFYPYPEHMYPLWMVIGAFGALGGGLGFIFLRFRRMPALSVGILWFLGTLVPVIGIVQAGLWPKIADRWAYIPLIGVFIGVCFSSTDLLKRFTKREKYLAFTALLVVLMFSTHRQTTLWQNTLTVFGHTVMATEDNMIAHNILGVAMGERGFWAQAIFHLKEAIRIDDGFGEAYANLGAVLGKTGNDAAALPYLKSALLRDPQNALICYNTGTSLARMGRLQEACHFMAEAVRLDPESIFYLAKLNKIFAELKGKTLSFKQKNAASLKPVKNRF